jgi:asparagine synthase (glutamine-hydrolysing)
MCGVNGIFAYQPAASDPRRDELAATRDAMSSRGPDGAGEWWSDDHRVAFGHRRLAIIDVGERGAQPMSTPAGDLTITFNGEIYNYEALRERLIAKGYLFRSRSDTEVLLHLYAEHGSAMVSELRGMFAFALWDERRKTLLMARDPYGIKPLYFADDGWTFRFASQVKALVAGGGVSREQDPAGIVGFQLWGHVPEPFTIYRDIRALPAGHVMVVDDLGPRLPERYWSVQSVLAASAALSHDWSDAGARANLVRQAALDSVRHHLVADVEVGVFLSAGIDSGSILGLAHDLGHDRIRAITLGFSEYSGNSDDETPLAREVAARYGARHVVRTVDEAEFRGDLPAILDMMDQPSIDGINTWFVAKAAREAGLRVALSGLGGDELLGGYPSFVDLPRWQRRYGLLSRLPGLGRLSGLVMRTFFPAYARRSPKAVGVLRHAGSWNGRYMLRRALYLPEELASLLDPHIVSEGLRRLDWETRRTSPLDPDPGSDAGRVTALESSRYMRDQLLRDADWAGMAQSVEIRTPLADRQMLEAIAPAIPALAQGEGKQLLARAPRVPLPVDVALRAKSGFTVPTGHWMASRAGIDTPAPTKGLISRQWSQFVLGSAGLSRTAHPSAAVGA